MNGRTLRSAEGRGRPSLLNLLLRRRARRGCFICSDPSVEGREIGGEALDEAAFRHFVAEIDGARKAQRIRAAVALHGYAVESQEGATVDAARVHLLFKHLEA